MWPFRRRHRPEDAPAVIEARENRDAVLEHLDEANEEIDRVHDQVVRDYEAAEKELKR